MPYENRPFVGRFVALELFDQTIEPAELLKLCRQKLGSCPGYVRVVTIVVIMVVTN